MMARDVLAYAVVIVVVIMLMQFVWFMASGLSPWVMG